MKRFKVLGAAALAILPTVFLTYAADTSAARFESLKAMAGDWTLSGGDGSVAATYRVTAGGTAVVETLLAFYQGGKAAKNEELSLVRKKS